MVVAGAELQREESEMHYDLSARTRGDFDGRTNQPFGRCIVKVMYDDVNTNELSWPSKSMEQVNGHNMYYNYKRRYVWSGECFLRYLIALSNLRCL